MVSRPAKYCPHCGTGLERITFDGHDRSHCPSCERVVWHNPVPCAGVAVVDQSRAEPAVLCVERAVPPGVGEWTIPGGHMEVGEEPEVAAARELEEETGVSVAPDALEILDATALPPRDGKHVVTTYYVADWADATGEPTAGSDAADARFWTPSAFTDSSEQFRPVHEERFRAAFRRFR
ncbi:NUDIX domain-containing protein [Natronobacterium gregoryi]|uniref:ADP-ribose pyrophosphatase n=2 Tax=Natronobacterium gregoryi TaxID=44930 RepID=L0AJ51_NATGS|nr:NUDIX domain-containing protein [Natronobacterium gregoryi]AFZ73182.1 ADP-ribose pyrophosphatase [Natronobacterium gregoryi SP2]ELY71361.1 NUDIX hydrolase [Natronobacterium gregoryi SP2]PLK21592.1 NUDIX domain-containing protein [Natronobacterium gregoryi SP2]SFI59188.1 ADP-ribose pyrophosphatase YjhB, NUDIX family [Natronobacterium gregoryi]